MGGNFNIDRGSKELFKQIMDGLFWRTITDVPEETTYPIDIFMTGLTSNGKSKAYAVELKERWKYLSTDYGTSASTEGWIIEDRKVSNLEETENSGYTPIYACFFKDGVLAVWDLSKLPEGWRDRRDGVKTFHLHTVGDEGGTYRKSKTGLWFKDCVMILKYDKERDSWSDCRERYS